MATLPVAALGALIGSCGFSLLAGEDGPWLGWSALALAGTIVSAVASTFVAAALVSPVVRSAVTTGSLRTEECWGRPGLRCLDVQSARS
jgi:hypothetical protein